MVQQAHVLFNSIAASPGRAEVTLAELRVSQCVCRPAACPALPCCEFVCAQRLCIAVTEAQPLKVLCCW